MSSDGQAAAGRIASIAMYRDPPVVAAATRALWALLRERLCASDMVDVPDALDEAIAHDAAWLDPRLLLAQTCSYPYAVQLRGKVRVVANPVYDHPGCAGATSNSMVIVSRESAAVVVGDLRGRTAVINDWRSNSGMNLLRHLIAPHAQRGRFFGQIIVSGSHVASIAQVAAGAADVAAIDCVTYGNLARHDPERLRGVRVLAETVRTPSLPYITRASSTDAELVALREALFGLIADPAAKDVRDTLGLRGFEVLPESSFDAVIGLEQEAAACGYPSLA
ncbi:PhnD/SsuA/transferrin family substrate-binding protein [Novosphingobium sp. Chol11]|uniref:phosphate/phosphite/phosphonate ABC transporter substrate-binding protein n=1 Tax=Novosphingobium sp. Chol11 TaxID=1385763 RepID=UPI0025EB9221|nr:PhnD/SsuA/transferrin family substrate-binding protein [Novosphingobium sp. Chol11]